LGNPGCCKKSTEISYSIEVGTSEVRVLTFGISLVIRLGLRNPRKKERKDRKRRYVGDSQSWVHSPLAREETPGPQ